MSTREKTAVRGKRKQASGPKQKLLIFPHAQIIDAAFVRKQRTEEEMFDQLQLQQVHILSCYYLKLVLFKILVHKVQHEYFALLLDPKKPRFHLQLSLVQLIK